MNPQNAATILQREGIQISPTSGNIMGGRMRILFSGGAPLSPEIKDFLQVIFSVNMFESYGTTETAGFLTSTAIWDR